MKGLRFLALLLAISLLLASFVACDKDGEDPLPDDGGNDFDIEDDGGDTEPVCYDMGTVGEGLSWEIYNDGTLYIKGTGAMPDFEYTGAGNEDRSYATYLNAYPYIKTLKVEAGVTSVSAKAFEGAIYLVDVTLSDTVTEISYDAFSGCTMLKSVSAKGVATVRDSAFFSCARLAKMTVGKALATVEYGAFFGASTTPTDGLKLTFTGSAAEWATRKESITVGEENGVFLTAMESPNYLTK